MQKLSKIFSKHWINFLFSFFLSLFAYYIHILFTQNSLWSLLYSFWWQNLISLKEWNFYFYHNPSLLFFEYNGFFLAHLRNFFSYQELILSLFAVSFLINVYVLFSRIKDSNQLWIISIIPLLLSITPLDFIPSIFFIYYLFLTFRKSSLWLYVLDITFLILFLPNIFIYLPFLYFRLKNIYSNKKLIGIGLGILFLFILFLIIFFHKYFFISSFILKGQYNHIFLSKNLLKATIESIQLILLPTWILSLLMTLFYLYLFKTQKNKKFIFFLVGTIITVINFYFILTPSHPILILFYNYILVISIFLFSKNHLKNFRKFAIIVPSLYFILIFAFFTIFNMHIPTKSYKIEKKVAASILIANLSPFNTNIEQLLTFLKKIKNEKNIEKIHFLDLSIVPSLRDRYIKKDMHKEKKESTQWRLHYYFYSEEKKYFKKIIKNLCFSNDLKIKNCSKKQNEIQFIIDRKNAKKLNSNDYDFPSRIEKIYKNNPDFEFIIYD